MLERCFTLVLSLIAFASFAQPASERYATIGLTADQYEILVADTTHGLAIDHFHKNEEGFLELIFSESELSTLDERAISYDVLIEDYQAHFQQLVAESPDNRSVACGLDNFDDGSMGGYHTYDEMVDHIMAMQDQYEDYVAIEEIGRSIEDRPIYAVKISDNPTTDESDVEGVVYFEAITHAREPMSLEATLYYMWWLLENNDSDAEVSYLLASREIYFVPIVNPDGYVYNETTNPNGGGLWRKNRRNVDGSCFGVDLNRNYTEGYGLNTGSSSDPCTQTYRGTEAQSEPESQAIAAFVDRIKPAVAFSSHTFGDKFLSPWGYTNGLPDFDLYAEFASEFIPEEYDGYGTTANMLNYTSSGTTRDHMHVNGTLTWTPEIGHSFWESPAVICDRVIEFRKTMLYITWLSGAYTCFHDFTVQSGSVMNGETVALDIRVKNRGFTLPADDVVVSVASSHSAVTVVSGEATIGTVEERSFGETTDGAIRIEINEDVTPGERLPFQVTVLQGGGKSYEKTIYLTAGTETTLYETDFEDAAVWQAGAGTWDTCSLDAVSGSVSFADSRLGNYAPNQSSLVMMSEPVDLTTVELPIVTFHAKWSLEVDDDFVNAVASTDGITWTELEGLYTDVFDRYTANSHWVQEQIDLGDYAGQPTVYVGFRLRSDATVHSDGFYIDDFKIADYRALTFSDIDETSQETMSGMSVAPNPATDYLLITSDVPIDQIMLHHIDGRFVEQHSAHARQNYRMDVSLFGSGLYILSVRDVEGVVRTRRVLVR